MPNEIHIFAAHEFGAVLYKYKEEFKCGITLLPKQVLKTPYSWAVRHDTDWVYAEGVS